MMKVYTCTDHDGHYPVGVASVILARDKNQATTLLDVELVEHGLSASAKHPYTLQEMDLSKAQAIVLCNGDY